MISVGTMVILCAIGLTGVAGSSSSEPAKLTLENERLGLEFDREAGSLLAIRNQLTEETIHVAGDTIAVETEEFSVAQGECQVALKEVSSERIAFVLTHPRLTAEVTWSLHAGDGFAEKQVTVVFSDAVRWTRMLVGRPSLGLADLEMVTYRYPSFQRIESTPIHQRKKTWKRPPDTEPLKTYFGRTARGGLFTGLELPFDSSSRNGTTVELSFAPSLHVKAGERVACEPAYFGVYRREARDTRAADWRPSEETTADDARLRNAAGASASAVLPLPSESAAMVAMTSAILGPPRHGLKAFACGWHCQMEHARYTPESLEADLKALSLLQECGLDGVTDSHPWGGETEKMSQLREGDAYELGPEVRRFLARARQLGLTVTQWPTMNNTRPWGGGEPGRPFRSDRPEWLRGVPGEAYTGDDVERFRQQRANCLACEPFFDWLLGIQRQALATGAYGSWGMDGDFWGSGAYFHTTIPVTCISEGHQHLPPDSNYACQRALNRLTAEVRRAYPDIYVVTYRPAMDLGVWSNRQVDACFTLIETGSGASNLDAGDEIRTASRIRVHHHFFPHTLDWPLLFPSYAGDNKSPLPWPHEHLDYILLSALSSSPNLLFYLPARTGIPSEDRAEIRRWLDWGRKHEAFLKVRRDLFDWPAADRVDGSAHILNDRGFVFLFNPGPTPRTTTFVLSEEIGLTQSGRFLVDQEYPEGAGQAQVAFGERVRWEVPAESVLVLRIQPVQD